ncbi:MAG: YggS family pyridoxal phosphate-dependent enzyme [Spirochaetales bacterium]|uniref:Pyridoxal phosphate homeostasis protein n=1 Tax=Candidatus Thalassospirochaeta sargassi TaxID=3119039 RepID=A0AAJ1MK12_9SPIO|nr:YggS family pyridoxal phosphate-dependent enzyme [Spirochaetales bacterium]
MLSERAQEIKSNIEKINAMIAESADSCGRNASEIKLMAVSKTKPVEDIQAAYDAGQRLFGENRINEAAEKFKQLPADCEMHMIGHLQSNKAKLAVESTSCVQSIDKLSTAAELNKRAAALSISLDYLVEINTSGENSKNGYPSFESFTNDFDSFLNLENLRLRGLMTIAPFTDDEEAVRKSFSELYGYYVKLQNMAGNKNVDILSMGMSSDFKIAIEEGSTLVRVGTAIFGSRNY